MPTQTINGRSAATFSEFDVINPATGAPFAKAPSASKAQVDEAFEAALAAYPGWRADEGLRRAKLLEASAAIAEAAGELTGILAEESGKTTQFAAFEAPVAAGWLGYYAGLELSREVLQDDEKARVEVVRRPLGVVGAITPWNMPIGLAFFKIAPALRAGNTVVLKPSPFTPLSTLRVGEILRDILPPGVLNIVSGGDDVGRWIVEHPVPRKISFTGSVAGGTAVNVAAAADLKRVTLELGGNDAAILLEDVDLTEIAPGLFWSAFFNNGQACALIKRVYVPRALYADAVEALADVARGTVVGDPADPATQLGPLATLPQFESVSGLVDHALAGGAKAATGGTRIDRPGYFYEPTIVCDIEDGTPLVDEEQFGPALPIIAYDDVDDAVSRVNRSTFGLGGSVWTADVERGQDIAERLDVGTTWINTHASLAPTVPFGGLKHSGLGVENGPWGLYAYTELQAVHVNRGVPGPTAG
ncbi:aldehyde dehydrogenase family protein [Mycolicibacterium anyangense]|nr:aldehyde dehydrogenase family protein [Mycolicibacterium anyangense]